MGTSPLAESSLRFKICEDSAGAGTETSAVCPTALYGVLRVRFMTEPNVGGTTKYDRRHALVPLG